MLVKIILYGSLLVSITILLHGAGTGLWMIFLTKLYKYHPHHFNGRNLRMTVLVCTGLYILFLHLIEILIWACAYYVIPEVKDILSWSDAIYFSMVTFTTLGYGDIVLAGNERLLTGIQSINGILLFGWSTAMLFMVIEFIWRKTIHFSAKKDAQINE